jgi:hypothetical protein
MGLIRFIRVIRAIAGLLLGIRVIRAIKLLRP